MGVNSQLHALAEEFGDGSQRYPLIGRLDGSQSRSGHLEVEKNVVPLSGIESQFHGCPACSLVAVPTLS
jgi:hypothetical protein